jgi:hypothetical protein
MRRRRLSAFGTDTSERIVRTRVQVVGKHGIHSEIQLMSAERAFNTPTETNAVDGEVVLIGPDSVALSMTPDAAEETGRRLIRAAGEARDQIAHGVTPSHDQD